eukprot:tig00021248_g19615.t1
MSMLDDPWRMAIPNPDEVLNGAFAIDGSLSVRGIYADEIRLRKGATYSDFLTSVGTLDDYGDLTAIIKGLWGVTTETGVDWNIIKRAADVKIANSVTSKDATLNLVKLTLKGAEGDVRPGYNALERIAGPLRHIYWSRQALPSMEPEQYRRDREEFFAWFDHFKVNIRALSADRTGETPETTGGGRIPTAPDVLPDRSDWAKTQNWALKDHFHDERYTLVKHPHVKADITDWAHRHLYDDIIGGPKVPGAIPGGGTAVPRGTMETQTTPRPDPRPAAERLPFARLGRSDQVKELIGLTIEDQRALFDALEQRRRADEEAAAKTEEERLKAMQTASDEEFARLEEPKVAGRKRALEAFKNATLDAMGAKMRELKRNESRNGEKIRALGDDIHEFTYVMNQLSGRGQKDAEELRRKMADEKWKNFERKAVQRPISDAIWIAYGDAEEMHRELRTEASLWRGALESSMYGMYKREFLAELRANPKTVSIGAQSAYVGMVNYVEKLSKFWEKRRAVIPAEGLAQYDAMVRDLEAFKREHPPAKYKLYIDTTAFIGELRKRGDEAKSQIEERYRKAQADKEYANRVIEERKQQAKENAARRNAEIEEQRRKIAERKAAEEEARKTKVETEYQALKREANQLLKRRGRAYADEGAGVGSASPDDITLAERDDVSVEEMRPGTARLPSEGVFQTLDRRVMGDSDVILRNALMPYGDWNRATADALADFDLERFTTKEQRDAYLGRPRARRPGRFISGGGHRLGGRRAGGTGSRAMRRAGAAAPALGWRRRRLLSAYQALSQGKIGEAEFFDTFRDQMIMTVGSFGLQTGMSSALSALTKMRIGTVGGLGLSILAGAIAQVIVDIINGRSAEEIVKNFFKYPVDWAADTIQFIAQLSQQIYDWGVETWGDEASQLRNRINRLEGELGSGFLGVYDPSEAREMASLLAQELRLNEIKEPKELQAFIRALDNSINDYRTPKDQKTLLEIDRATVLFLSQLTVKMQEGFGSTSLALSRLMRDLKQMVKEETKGRKRVLIAVYQEGLNRINHIEALRREFGSAIRHSGVSSNGGAQVARLADANSRLEIPGTFRMQDWWEAEAFRNYGAFIDNGINSQSPKANWLVPKAYVDKLVDRPAAPYTKKIAKGIEYWAPEPGQPVVNHKGDHTIKETTLGNQATEAPYNATAVPFSEADLVRVGELRCDKMRTREGGSAVPGA